MAYGVMMRAKNGLKEIGEKDNKRGDDGVDDVDERDDHATQLVKLLSGKVDADTMASVEHILTDLYSRIDFSGAQ